MNLEQDNTKSLWFTIRPSKLPRDVTNITVASVYYPPQAYSSVLKDHLDQGTDFIFSKHPSSGLLVLCDFKFSG